MNDNITPPGSRQKALTRGLMLHLRRLLSIALNIPGWRKPGHHFPKPKQFAVFHKVLTFRERVILTLGFLLFATGTLVTAGTIYLRETETVPARGGTLIEGVVSQVLFINPVIPATLADRDLASLTYAGLMRYDREGKLVPDIAQEYAVGEEGRIIEFALREDLQWPDGKKVTAEDVVYTVQLVQNPAVRSPFFAQWLGVEVQALDEHVVRFTLPSPYAPFLHATTLGILPKHLWEDTEPENLSLSELNLRPQGLGPYTLSRFERTREGKYLSFTLQRNTASHRKSFIATIVLRLFDTEEDALSAFLRQELDAVAGISENTLGNTTTGQGTNVHRIPMPRVFGVYFNQSLSKALADATVRKALAYATNKKAALDAIGGEQAALLLSGPLSEGVVGFTHDIPTYDLAVEHANNILEAEQWTYPQQESENSDQGTETGDQQSENSEQNEEPPAETPHVRQKGTAPNIVEMRFTITTAEGDLENVAHALAEQWKEIGAIVDIQALPPTELREAIAQRSYTALLVGVDMLPDPDLFALFHSSQRFDPGRNFALYNNDNVDKLLEEGRKVQDAATRESLAQRAQQLVMEDAPAIFLWSERFRYIMDSRVKGFGVTFLPSPPHRFSTIEEWYVVTKRVPK